MNAKKISTKLAFFNKIDLRKVGIALFAAILNWKGWVCFVNELFGRCCLDQHALQFGQALGVYSPI